MNTIRKGVLTAAAAGLLAGACAAPHAAIMVNKGSVAPASAITRQGVPVRLLGSPLAVGAPLPSTNLVQASTMQTVDLARERGKVLFLSVVVSIDTAV